MRETETVDVHFCLLEDLRDSLAKPSSRARKTNE